MPDPKPVRLEVAPGPRDRTVRMADGSVKNVPAGWSLLPPGDAGLTRRVKAATATWTVKEKKGRRTFSRGVWADKQVIASERRILSAERDTPAYAKRRAAAKVRRDRQQSEYVDEFFEAVLGYLSFHPRHELVAVAVARAVTRHATPVGSGTVARTSRIPVSRRAEAAVIAWMRHQTTAYDDMTIARVKGRRREVRRQLAAQSKRVLASYRNDRPPPKGCPLAAAVGGGDRG